MCLADGRIDEDVFEVLVRAQRFENLHRENDPPDRFLSLLTQTPAIVQRLNRE